MFTTVGRIVTAAIQVTGYTAVFVCQVAWFAAHGQRDRIGFVMGQYGKWTVDALARVFRTG